MMRTRRTGHRQVAPIPTLDTAPSTGQVRSAPASATPLAAGTGRGWGMDVIRRALGALALWLALLAGPGPGPPPPRPSAGAHPPPPQGGPPPPPPRRPPARGRGPPRAPPPPAPP